MAVQYDLFMDGPEEAYTGPPPKPTNEITLEETVARGGAIQLVRRALDAAANRQGQDLEPQSVVDSIALATGAPREQILASLGVGENVTASTGRHPGDDMDASSTNYRYRDTGYIAGSRKELAAQRIRILAAAGTMVNSGDIDWDEIEQNPRAARELIVKSNLFGQVDWETLKAGGMEPGAGFLTDRVYASIAKEPDDSAQSRQDFAAGINTLRNRLEAAKTVADVLDVLTELRSEIMGEVYSANESESFQSASQQSSTLFRKMLGLEKERQALWVPLHKINIELNELTHSQNKRTRRGWKEEPEIAARIEELNLEYAKNEKLIHEWDAAHPELDRVKDEQGRFASALQKEAWAAEAAAEQIRKAVVARNLNENPITRAWLGFGPRFLAVVDYRGMKGSDAFAQHVTNARLGKIKDWSWLEREVPSSGRKPTQESVRFQLKVAETFERIGGRPIDVDSTAELKAKFGLREIQSGNWVLRDVAAGRFHTRQAAAALMDLADILGLPDQALSHGGRLALAFGARGNGAIGFSDSAPGATYESIERVINITKNGKGGYIGHEWAHSFDNLLSETFGGPAAGKGDWLTEGAAVPPGAAPLAQALKTLHDAIFSGDKRAVKTFEYSAKDYQTAKLNVKHANYGPGKTIRDAGSLEAAFDSLKQKHSQSPKQARALARWNTVAVAWYGADPDGGKINAPYGPLVSNFVLGAIFLDADNRSPYWTKPRELAARAFQSYLEDSLAAKGRKNDYLSVYADNKYHVDPLLGIKYKPFPEGEERTRINNAFDGLFDVVRELVVTKEKTLAHSAGGIGY